MELEEERGVPALGLRRNDSLKRLADAAASLPGPRVAAPAAGEPAEPRILAKSLAVVPEAAVHDALAAISEGAAVAFDLRRGMDHHFAAGAVPDGLLEGLTDLAPEAPARLLDLLVRTSLREELRRAFALLATTVAQTVDRQTLLQRRFVIIHQGHVLFDAAMILDHTGSQVRTCVGPGRPTIYLPLDLLTFVGDAGPAAQEDLRFLLEHADFHLRGNPGGGVVVNGHPYSSLEEHSRIGLLWGQHRRAAVERCRAHMDLLDAGDAAYWSTVLYLLGAMDLVMADQVPIVLQRLETTGDDLCAYIPEMHATFWRALGGATGREHTTTPTTTRFKLILLDSVDRSVVSILEEHGIALPGDVMATIDRASAGVLAIRRTLDGADLAALERIVATADLGGEQEGAAPDGEDAWDALLDDIVGRAGGHDLWRAAVAMRQLPLEARDPALLADSFLLSRHEARLLAGIARLAERDVAVTRRPATEAS
jgi:hypothetical protein